MFARIGFSLLELMISIALASVVLLAINQMTLSSVRLEEHLNADGETMNQVQDVITDLVSEMRSADPESVRVDTDTATTPQTVAITYRACIGFIGVGDFALSDTTTDNIDGDPNDYVLFGVDNAALGTDYEYVRRIYLDNYDPDRQTWTLKQDRGDGGASLDTTTVTLATDISAFNATYDSATARLELDLASTAQVRDEVTDNAGNVLSAVTNTNNARLQIFLRSQKLSSLLGSTAISSGSLNLNGLASTTSGFDTTSFFLSSTATGDGITGTIQIGGDGTLDAADFTIIDEATGTQPTVENSDGDTVPLEPNLTFNGNIVNFTAAGLDKNATYTIIVDAVMDGVHQPPASSDPIVVQEVTSTGSNPGGGKKK
jgi:prepilin-type N-terminal cleavage/methylation domain-containing protein